MESYILIAGLILFSGTTIYDLHAKSKYVNTTKNTTKIEIKKESNSNTTNTTGFFNQDFKK